MATFCISSAPASGAPGEVHTTKDNDLGAERDFLVDGVKGSYVYLAGAASLADGEWVTYQPGTWTAARLVAGAKGSVAVATAAVSASTSYGWFLIIGTDTAVCESSIVSNANCYATATTGRVDDAIVKNDQVKGAKTTAAGAGGGTATVVVNRPYIGSYDESA